MTSRITQQSRCGGTGFEGFFGGFELEKKVQPDGSMKSRIEPIDFSVITLSTLSLEIKEMTTYPKQIEVYNTQT